MREPKPNLVQLSIISLRTSSNPCCNLAHYGDKTCSDAVLPDQRRRTPAPDPRGGRGHARRSRAGDRPRPLDRRPARRRTARAGARLRGRRQRLDRWPPGHRARVQPRGGGRPRRRPRRDACPSGGERSRRHAARRAGIGPGHRRRPGSGARLGGRALRRAPRGGRVALPTTCTESESACRAPSSSTAGDP